MKSKIHSIPWYLERAIPGVGYHSSSHRDCGYLYMQCCGTFLFRFLVLCLEFEAGQGENSDLDLIEEELVAGYEEMLKSIFLDSVSVPIHHAENSYRDYECNIPDELLSTAIEKLENVLELKVFVAHHHQKFIKGLIQTVLLNMADSEVATQVCDEIKPLFRDDVHASDAYNVIGLFEEDFIVDNFELIDSSPGQLAKWFKTIFEQDMEWTKS